MQLAVALAKWLYGSLIALYEQPDIWEENTNLLDIKASFNPPMDFFNSSIGSRPK